MMQTLHIAVLGLTAIAVTAMITNHDGTTVQACIGGILTVCGYAMFQMRKNGNGNGNNGQSKSS